MSNFQKSSVLKNKKLRVLWLLAVFSILLTLLTACGGDINDDETDAAEPADTAAVSEDTGCSESGSDQQQSANITDARYTHLSMDEAQKMIEAGTPDVDYVLLDTRQVNVYKHDHIPGAICIPDTDITAMSDDYEIPELPDKSQKIIVYCQFGGVSKIAAEKLCDMGYTNIYEFDGMDYWNGEVEYGDDYE